MWIKIGDDKGGGFQNIETICADLSTTLKHFHNCITEHILTFLFHRPVSILASKTICMIKHTHTCTILRFAHLGSTSLWVSLPSCMGCLKMSVITLNLSQLCIQRRMPTPAFPHIATCYKQSYRASPGVT